MQREGCFTPGSDMGALFLQIFAAFVILIATLCAKYWTTFINSNV